MSLPPHIGLVAPNASDFAARYAELLSALVRAGAEVTVHAEGAGDASTTLLGVAWHSAPTRRSAAGGLGVVSDGVADAALVAMLVARWTETRPTVVHALSAALAPAVTRAARMCGVPHVVVTLDSTFENAIPAGARRSDRALRRVLGTRLSRAVRAADRTIAMHAGARDSWVAVGVKSAHCRLIDSGMGIALGDFFDGPSAQELRAAARGRLGLDADAVVVSVTGGTGEESAELAGRFPDAIWLPIKAGEVLQAPAPDALLAADVVISLHRRVEQALALQKAAALEIPTISWRVPGNTEVVRHGQSGVLARPFSPEGVVVGLTALMVADTRKNAGDLARSLAARLFDRDLAVRKILSTYDELLSGETAQPARVDGRGMVVSGRDLVG